MKILIKNGRVIDPVSNIDGIRDIVIDKGKISRVGRNIQADAEKIIRAEGKFVLPGLVDMHVHLREPGREDKETVASGTRAAAKGGITSLLAMPNTMPCIDCESSVNLLRKIIKRKSFANVFISAAITKDRLGEELTDLERLKKMGIAAITDDGGSVDSDDLFFKALKTAGRLRIPVIAHCENKSLSRGGVVNSGIISTKLGLRGITRESEYKRVGRDIKLAEKAGCHLHIAHVSCKESVELIAKAKKRGVLVTAESAPHYFTLTEAAASEYNTNMKINPPLRRREDVDSIIKGLKKGVIDVIASDHAPHTGNEKMTEFERAEFGTIGLETILAVSITALVHTGILSWAELVNRLSFNPARILGINKGTLKAGEDADLVIIDPDREWLVDEDGFASKSKNSAFIGFRLKGMVEYTLCNGKLVYSCQGK